MVAINYIYASIALVVLVLVFVFVYIYNFFKKNPVEWGDISSSIVYYQVRRYLLRNLEESKDSQTYYWRLKILLIINSPVEELLKQFQKKNKHNPINEKHLVDEVNKNLNYEEDNNKKINENIIANDKDRKSVDIERKSIDIDEKSKNTDENENIKLIKTNQENDENIEKVYFENNILYVANEISKNKGGFLMAGYVRKEDPTFDFESGKVGEIKTITKNFVELFKQLKIKAIPCVISETNYSLGVQNLLIHSGLGELSPNTIILPFFYYVATKDKLNKSNKKKKNFIGTKEYIKIVTDCLFLKKNIIMTRFFHTLNFSQLIPEGFFDKYLLYKTIGYIDIWLLNLSNYTDEDIEPTTSLCLTIGYLLKQSYSNLSKYHQIRVISIVNRRSNIKKKYIELKKLIKKSRFGFSDFKIMVIPLEKEDFNCIKKTEVFLKISPSRADFHRSTDDINEIFKESLEKKELEKIDEIDNQNNQNSEKKTDDSSSPLNYLNSFFIKEKIQKFNEDNNLFHFSEEKIPLTNLEKFQVTNSVIKRISTSDNTHLVFISLPPMPNKKDIEEDDENEEGNKKDEDEKLKEEEDGEGEDDEDMEERKKKKKLKEQKKKEKLEKEKVKNLKNKHTPLFNEFLKYLNDIQELSDNIEIPTMMVSASSQSIYV